MNQCIKFLAIKSVFQDKSNLFAYKFSNIMYHKILDKIYKINLTFNDLKIKLQLRFSISKKINDQYFYFKKNKCEKKFLAMTKQ